MAALIKEHPEPETAMVDALQGYLERDDLNAPMVARFARDMLGLHADKGDPLHKAAPQIVGRLLAGGRRMPERGAKAFVTRFALSPLGLDIGDRDQLIADQRLLIERNEKQLGTPPQEDPTSVLTPAQERKLTLKALESNKAFLRRLESNFDGWVEERHRSAVRRIAISLPTRKALEVMEKALPRAAVTPITDLLAAARRAKDLPRKFPMPTPADRSFADFGLKVLVIEELMYEQKVLQPLFDVREFVREYLERHIDVEAEGTKIIPEVKRWFQTLPIGPDLLARVERLHQSSGLDGGARVIKQLQPGWDPGFGDGPVPVTAKAVRDLHLLPKLRVISGLENSEPPKSLLKALTERGVRLLPEEDAGPV